MVNTGAEILVVPDGFKDDGVLAFLALQVTPSLRVGGKINLAKWPSEIARLAQRMSLVVGEISGGNAREVGKIPCRSALFDYHFEQKSDGKVNDRPSLAMADALWSKVFDVDAEVNFDALATALGEMHGAALDSVGDAAVLPSHTADMHLFYKLQQEGSPDPGKRAPVADRAALWRRITRWMEQGPDASQLAYLERVGMAEDPSDFGTRQAMLRRSLEDLLFAPDGVLEDSEDALRSQARAAAMFRGYFLALQPAGSSTVLLGEDDDRPATPPPDLPPEEGWQSGPSQVAGRKLSTLLSMPSLALYLGLGIEVAVKRDDLLQYAAQHNGVLALAVEFVDEDGSPVPQGAPRAWTACDIDTGANAAYFAPRPQNKLASAVPQDRGLIKAGAKLPNNGGGRFRLTTEDVANMTMDRVHATLYGDPNTFAQVDDVRRNAGFVVYDSLASDDLRAELANDARELIDEAGDKLNWAEDLLRGARPDFAVCRATGDGFMNPANLVWRQVTWRETTCDDAEFDTAFLSQDAVKRMLHRDHAVTQVPVEEKALITPNGAKRFVEKIDEMFVWQGESLAIPRNLEEPDDGTQTHANIDLAFAGGEGIASPREKDLGLKIKHSLPSGGLDGQMQAESKMMPLREDVPYAVAMRAVYANGVSLPFSKAVEDYGDAARFAELVLGDEAGKAVTFPRERASPPGVHLPWQDPLVNANDLRKEAPGASITTLVVRSGSIIWNTAKAGRFVTPPRASFDLAERQGQFNKVTEAVPPGAMSGSDGLWRFGPDGAFPEARFGRKGGAVRYLKDGNTLQFVSDIGYSTTHPSVALADESIFGSNNQSRGTVAILGPQPGAPKPGRFYPHKHAKTLEARAVQLTYRDRPDKPARLGGAEETLTEKRDFWSGNDPLAATPLYLELLQGSTDAEFTASKTQTIDRVSGGSSRLPALQVKLGAGEIYELRLNSFGGTDDDPVRGEEAVLRLVHAVNKPLGTISYQGSHSPTDDPAQQFTLGLNAVTVSVSETENATRVGGAPPTWKTLVKQYGKQDMLEWESIEGGDTTFIVGRIGLDRKSTGNLRIEATWDDYDGETVTLHDGKWVRNISKLRATLMAIDIERDGDHDAVDLLQTGKLYDGEHLTGELRGQTYAVPKDGQLAREYDLKIVTGTAFKEFFDGGLETLATRTLVLKKQCTFRPPPPKLTEVQSWFVYSDVDDPKTVGQKRRTRLRFYIGEKWYVSGKGEKLGIVLKRPGVGIPPDSRFAPFVSVAGSDPTLRSAKVPEYLDSSHFKPVDGQASDFFDSVDLFLPEQTAGVSARITGDPASLVEGEDKLSVDILALTPQFSEDEGLYCDVEITFYGDDGFNPYNAFVHFGLVRFQDNAVRHLRSSFPLKDPKTKVYLLPDRDLRVIGDNSTLKRTLRLTGSGYLPADPAEVEPGRKKPVLDATLMRWCEARRRWIALRKVADRLEPEVDANMTAEWRVEFRRDRNKCARQGGCLCPQAGMTRHVLLVEEFERLPQEGAPVPGGGELGEYDRIVFSYMQKLDGP